MGMDVCGNSGNYFRANIWGWHPLARYCQQVGYFLSEACRYWHTNDGDGLAAYEADLLGRTILREIELGNTQKAVEAYNLSQTKKVCEFCDGKKYRETPNGSYECGFCKGSGNQANYNSLSVERIKEFAEFLIESEGFSIY